MSPTVFKHKGYRFFFFSAEEKRMHVHVVSNGAEAKLGVWILINEKEYYMPFADFPWFRNADHEHILNVKEVSPNHYFWEDLDVDLTLNMIINPDAYPLRDTYRL